MCGIVGIKKEFERVAPQVFDSMVDSLSSRGPDGRGVKALDEGRLYLGHRRLSIIDLSETGSQPMSNEDNSLWLTFNGEIYNYRLLRRELKCCGHVFRSQSDSETIIHAYEEWGSACVGHFRGIFAFAIYDCRQKSLFLARDHVGVKPLYYYNDQDSFVFASQPRAILASEKFRARVDQKAFSLFLAYGNVPGDVSIYEGVRKLLPGHWLLLKDNKLEIKQYWSLIYSPTIFDPGEAEILVRTKVEESVCLQTVSDVRIGTLLSGGVDSTIITSILANGFGSDLSSYTIGFDEKESDEREYANFVAKSLQTNHQEQLLSYADACLLLPDITEAYDEPFHLNGLFPFFALSRLVECSGGKVVLGGDGADELFAGYLWYEYFSDSLKPKKQLPFLHKLSSAFGLDFTRREVEPVKDFFYYNGFFDSDSQKNILGKDVVSLNNDVYGPLTRHWKPELPPVLSGQLLDFNCFQVDHCLTKVDRASMACGVEVRVPFLDVELIELVFSINHEITFKSGERKALLKQAMRNELPKGMNTGRKKGFSSPLNVWLENGIAKAGENLILDGSLCSRDLLNGDGIKNGYSNMDVGNKLLLISAELWALHWLEGDKEAINQFSRNCLNDSVGSNA